jgi:ATP-dependent RNA helicase RhlE
MLQILSGSGRRSSNSIRALVLVPTRELAAQVYESVVDCGRHLKIRSTVAYGGVKINPQMIRLSRGADVLVATPGRLLDLHRQNAVRFSDLEVLVFDEADRMLNLGFKDEVEEVLNLLPEERQNMMFTATFSEPVRELARRIVRNPLEVTVRPREITVDAVRQHVYPVAHTSKTSLLLKLMEEKHWIKFLIFVKTKNRADRLVRKLIENGYIASAIHGDKSQGARTRALAEFRKDSHSILVATDLAARGLDISGLPLVVNFDMPHLKEDYVHRIGRTGRAGRMGEAVSFVSPEEFDKLKDVERLTRQVIPRTLAEGFELDPPLPESKLDTRPFKPKKPKKKKNREQNTVSP